MGSLFVQELWSNLKLKFTAPIRQNTLQLKSTLQNLKKGIDNIETYMDKIKAIRDVLATVGVFLDDEDIVVTVLRGLLLEYTAFKIVIKAQFVSCSMGELNTLLKDVEIDADNEAQSIPHALTVMVVAHLLLVVLLLQMYPHHYHHLVPLQVLHLILLLFLMLDLLFHHHLRPNMLLF